MSQDPKTKYEDAVKRCDAAWEAYEASGFTSGRKEFRDAYGKKVMAFSELRKAS